MSDIEDQRAQNALAAERARGQELLKIIDLGLQVSQFLDGPLGQRLLKDSEEERADKVEQLVGLNPDDEMERGIIRQVRARIAVLDHWQDLFTSYIKAGHDAEVQFQDGVYVPTDAEDA